MEEKILPILRFDNFNDYWQKSSLLSQVEVRRGLTYKPNDVRSNGARVLRSSNIVDDSFVISDDDVFVSKDVINIPRVSNGDILVTAANGSTKLVGKHAIIKNLPDDEIVVHGGFMLLFKTEQNYFVNAWMSSNEYKRVLQFVQGGNGAIGNLSSAILKSMKMSVPSLPEQSAIGFLFRYLDDLLASYKDNLTNYQSLKATMLSKMFSKAGQTVPEIRLGGFEGKWEVQNLKELASFSKGNGYTKNDLVNSGKEIILYGRLYTNYQTVISQVNTFVTTVKANAVISKGGEVIVPASGESAEDISRASVVEKSGVILGGDLNIIYPDESKVDSIFLALTISNGSQQKELIKRAQGKSVVHLRNNDLEKVLLHYPSMEEQQAIGKYFTNLDNLIISYQEKIPQLETLKKKLLQDMFI